MKKTVKSYWAFSNTLYRLIMLFLVPVAYLLVSVCLPSANEGGEADPVWIIMVLALYFLDAQSDCWFMGGFYAKHNGALEFMQTSNQFQSFMSRVVSVDILRRTVYYLGLPLIGVCIGMSKGYDKEWYQMFSYLPVLEFFLAQLAVAIGRHFVMWNQAYAVVMLGFLIITITIPFGILVSFKNTFAIDVILLILAITMAVFTVWYTEKKVRESYYDR